MKRFEIDGTNYSFEELLTICGVHDSHLELIRQYFQVDLTWANQSFTVGCEDEATVWKIKKVIDGMVSISHIRHQLNDNDIRYLLHVVDEHPDVDLKHLSAEAICKTASGKMIYPKTLGQMLLVDTMDKNDVTFSMGVAGTGKTYLAVCYAVNELKKGNYQRLILTRPAVEAGESLGFLPGDLKEKVDPYLRPLYDALYDSLGSEMTLKLMEKEVIEIAPLAYMRGRTLDHAIIILDEAQNTTRSQMKMFLTRMGFDSKIIITGDVTQIDLIKKQDSGLINACNILKGIDGIGFVELGKWDVVRHPMVQKIIECYEKYESEK